LIIWQVNCGGPYHRRASCLDLTSTFLEIAAHATVGKT
jgi:hypothetical protein